VYKIAFAVAVVLLLFLQSFFDTTVHTVSANHHVFSYGFLAWLFFALFVLIVMGFAIFAWKKMNEPILAGIMLLGIPLICFAALPQICYERVELTGEHLIHRREPPHTKYNFDIPWSDMTSVTEIKKESGSFSTYYEVGYRITTRGGQYELPSNTVLTAAHETIDNELTSRNIPVKVEIQRRPPPQ
jgi:hypothetical protein